ncbi:hypothetical protein C7271_23840 [filamentous cyanobacterium CCP5]|nr:hypothetical protein C7271_23840 [filamentous cyanobacterium CCP5]
MLDPAPFTVNHPDYRVIRLTRQDSDRLQVLYAACTDFFVMTEGTAPSLTAAQDEFTDVPEGKSPDDLHFFGLCNAQERLVGVITTAQQYPDEETWWIGLMLLAPDQRGRGLGSAFYQAFEQWLVEQGVNNVALSAIAPNTSGRAFWQRMGFKEIRQTPPRTFGKKTHTVHVFCRRLDQVAGENPMMAPYLSATAVIDWQHPAVLALAHRLAAEQDSVNAIAQACFEWVRDEICHSVDYQMNPVTCRASDALQHKTGYCFAKSHLLAALLRANHIPAGFCYQRLSLDDRGAPYSLHGFNAIYLPEWGWYRIDPRGNKPGVNAQFSPPQEHLAYQPQLAEEADFPAILAEPLAIVVAALQTHSTWDALLHQLPDITPQEADDLGLLKVGQALTRVLPSNKTL